MFFLKKGKKMTQKISIAIDGPASAGKSTVAKIVAKQLHYIYCDTGAMYRAITLAALKQEVDTNDEQRLVDLLKQIVLQFKPTENGQKVYLNHKDVTEEIRQSNVTNAVSVVAAHKKVREKLVEWQRNIAQTGGIVMDGRDIGTAVLPNAEVKIFLIASVEERARRRYEENFAKGMAPNLEVIKKEIEQRDYLDSTRINSPLIQAEDAILLDTTGLSIEEVVKKIVSLAKKALKNQ